MLKLFFSFTILFTSDFLRLSAKTEVAPGKGFSRSLCCIKTEVNETAKNIALLLVENTFWGNKNKAKVEIVFLGFYLV